MALLERPIPVPRPAAAMEDDFDLPEEEPEQTTAPQDQTCPELRKPTTTRTLNKRARLEPQDDKCGVTGCPDLRKSKSRFCFGHDRHFANMRYQASRRGAAQLAAFNEMMSNLLVASEEILKFAAVSAASPDAKRKALISWTELNKSYGEKLEQGDHKLDAPYEKEHFAR